MVNLNWRLIWQTLHAVQYQKLPTKEAISSLTQAGLRRDAAIAHFVSTVEHGYVMGRREPPAIAE